MKTLKLSAAAGLLLLAAGCAQPQPADDHFARAAAAIDAYRRGDQVELEKTIAGFTADLPADQTTGVYMSCAADGYRLRLWAQMRKTLMALDKPEILGMGEAAKLVHLQDVVIGGGGLELQADGDDGVGGPLDTDCATRPDYLKVFQEHTAQDEQRKQQGRERLNAWRAELKGKLGADYDAQMQAASRALSDRGLRGARDWEERS